MLSTLARLRTAALVTAFSLSAARHPAIAQSVASSSRALRVVGRVTSDDPTSLPHATVAVTVAGRRLFVRTNESGAYEVRFDSIPRSTASIAVSATAIGYRPFTATSPLAADSMRVRVDVSMLRNPTALASVRVTARRRPGLGDAAQGDIGTASDVVGSEGAVGLADRGNLSALALSLSGVTPITRADGSQAGFSVLGTPAAQSNVTLNGLAFDGDALPRGAFVTTRLSTSPLDPMSGGFSGGQLAVHVSAGSNYTFGGVTATLDDPRLQAAGASARALGLESRRVSVSATRSGPISIDKSFYNVAAQIDHRESPLAMLGSGVPVTLDRAGLTPAALTPLLSALDSLRVPRAPAFDTRRNTGASLLARVDLAPTSTRAFNLTFDAQGRTISGFGGASDGLTANVPTSSRFSSALQSDYSRFIGDRYTLRSRTGFSVATDRLDAGTGPSGHVLVVSPQADGATTLSSVAFGRGDAVPGHASHASGESIDELSWYAHGTAHQLKLGVQLRGERSTWNRDIGTNGRWTFNSVADLQAGLPSSFFRSLDTQRGNIYAAGAAVGVGDVWRVTPRVQLQMALRAEGDLRGPGARGAESIASMFDHEISERAPGFGLLPRAGFTWAYGHQESGYGGSSQPRGVIRGGFGAYRTWLGSSSVENALAAAGDPARVACVGNLAPLTSWNAADDATLSCGTMAPSTAALTTFARNFEAPTSWRSTLGWNAGLLGARVALDGSYSRNLHQSGFVDLNFAGVPGFALPDEGGRVVFAPADRIDVRTGAIDPATARRDSSIATAGLLTSELRGETTQLRASIASDGSPIASAFNWGLTYTFTNARAQTRGFDSPTANDPRQVLWSAGAYTAPHQFVGNLGWRFGETGYLNASGQLRAGVPFTPLVLGDVNGDGRFDDPAFVFDPSNTKDPSLAREMRTLLADAPAAAKHCLTRQLGQIASPNSCAGAWTFDATVSASVSGATIGLPKRARLIYTISNPVAGIDRLLHGDNARGWGSSALPDPRLLAITGFDPATRRYQYAVNDAFGATTTARIAERNPFRLSVEVYLPLGRAREQQLVSQVLGPGRSRGGRRLTAEQIKSRLIRGAFIDPIRVVVASKDSLLLSDAQDAELKKIGTSYSQRLDAIWTPVAQLLADEGADPDFDTAVRTVRTAEDSAWDAMADAARGIRTLLSPEQLDLLTPEIRDMLTDAGVARMRRITQTAF